MIMNTRLSILYQAYLDAKKERNDLFNKYKETGEPCTNEEKCNVLYNQYQAKINYLKQYHGKHYDELYKLMTHLRLEIIHSEYLDNDVYQRYEKAKQDFFLDGSEI